MIVLQAVYVGCRLRLNQNNCQLLGEQKILASGDGTEWERGMKTISHLNEQITSFDNLSQSFRLALQADLRSQIYALGQYHNFSIYEPRRRLVSPA